MVFPANITALRSAGYQFLDFGICDGCNSIVEWWRTPKGRQIPINPMHAETSPARPHWVICPEVTRYKQKMPVKKDRGGKRCGDVGKVETKKQFCNPKA